MLLKNPRGKTDNRRDVSLKPEDTEVKDPQTPDDCPPGPRTVKVAVYVPGAA